MELLELLKAKLKAKSATDHFNEIVESAARDILKATCQLFILGKNGYPVPYASGFS